MKLDAMHMTAQAGDHSGVKKLPSSLVRFVVEDSGATAIEYGVIAAVIGLGVLSGIKALAGANTTGWNGTATTVSDAVSTN